MTRINTTTYNVKIFSVEKFGGTAQRHNFGKLYEFDVVGGI